MIPVRGRHRARGSEAAGLASLLLLSCLGREAPAADAALTLVNARGAVDAPVLLEEFTDFQCPFCARSAEALREVCGRYRDKVRWVVRAFPLAFHEHARTAHEAALTAGEWGKFWEMHARLFAAQEDLSRPALVAHAAALGIAAEDFEAVLDAQPFAEDIERDVDEARRRGVDGTPTLFLNGRLLRGGHSVEAIEYQIRRALDLPAELPSTADPAALLADPETGHPFAFGPERGAPVVKVFYDLRSPLAQRAMPRLERLIASQRRRTRFVLKGRLTGIYADSAAAHAAHAALLRRGADPFKAAALLGAVEGTVNGAAAGAVAQRLGLGERGALEVAREVETGAHAAFVESEDRLARRLEVRGVPAAILDGRRFDGIAGLEKLERELRRLGQGAPPPPLAAAGAERCDKPPALRDGVAGPIAFLPSGVQRLAAAAGEIARLRLEARSLRQAPLALRFSGSDVDGVTAELKEIEPGRLFAIELSGRAPPLPGKRAGRLRFAVDGGAGDSSIAVELIALPEIVIAPPRLLIDADAARGRRPLRLHLRSARLDPFTIESIHSTLPCLKVPVRPSSAETDHRLLVQVAAESLPPDGAEGVLVLRTRRAAGGGTLAEEWKVPLVVLPAR